MQKEKKSTAAINSSFNLTITKKKYKELTTVEFLKFQALKYVTNAYKCRTDSKFCIITISPNAAVPNVH